MIHPKRSVTVLGAVLTLSCLVPTQARAESSSHRLNSFLSGSGNIAFLAAGTLLPLVEDGPDGTTHTVRAVDAVATSVALSEGLKLITREKRPDSDQRNSFPSGHATAAFAVATVESHYHPAQAIFWYAGATAISASRVALHRHYVHDVLAGAALGYFTARETLKHPHFMRFAPDAVPSRTPMGIGLRYRF